MLMKLLRTAIGLAVVFLLAQAPGNAAFLLEAHAETETETGAEVIDCVLPGKIRPLGSTTYITREQTIKTTRKDCKARGGKPVIPEEPETEKSGGEPAGQDDHSPR